MCVHVERESERSTRECVSGSLDYPSALDLSDARVAHQITMSLALALTLPSSQKVSELSKCQDAIAKATPELAGFVSGYTIDQIERLEAHNATQVWAPYYTLHKIMAGG